MRYIFFFLVFTFSTIIYSQTIHHEIAARINIKDQTIMVLDSVRIPVSYLQKENGKLFFVLNSGFMVKSVSSDIFITEVIPGSSGVSGVSIKKYEVKYPANYSKGFTFLIKYSGIVNGGLKSGATEYARGFSETDGIISETGIYLSNSTVWYPYFEGQLFTFSLNTWIDSAWSVVSQGVRVKNVKVNDMKIVRYETSYPSDEIFLTAAKWTEYNKIAGKVLVQAELRTPDADLAYKYLDATIIYLEMYEKLIGAYPYSKFTLVENFWETGYGMPSFTLLGEKIIRFPFIITSSYPHELLHNYWGNSVYVNYNTGNWCEGITAYMADHLFKEQQGQGAEYRRGALQKFSDYVNETNDFPLSKFGTRHNSVDEAIGYGKTLMIFEMLRNEVGDKMFVKSFSNFYLDNKFLRASFDDIRKAFESVCGKDLKPFFEQWIYRTGAPSIKLSDVTVINENNQYKLEFTLSQIQKEDPFILNVPIAIYLESDEEVTMKYILVSKRQEKFVFSLKNRPAKLEIDPQFNVFRRLDKSEAPLSLTQIFGDTDVVMILPKASPFIKEYESFAGQRKEMQAAQGGNVEIIYDSDLNEIPDKATWIIGFENKFASNINVFNDYKNYLSKDIIDQAEILGETGALVYVFANNKNNKNTNVFFGSNNKNMIEVLKNKLSYYGKYSYLGFISDKGENKLKGEFPVVNSSMSFQIKYDGKTIPSNAKIKLRKALIE